MIPKFKIAAILLFQLLVYFGYSQDQEFKFKSIIDQNGKSLGKINAIAQDPYGYMWFASQGEKCIYRYDGNRFTTFRHDGDNPNSLGVVSIETLYADAEGLIWIGGNGLDQYDPKTGIFKHYRHEIGDAGSLGNNNIIAILKDHRGRLWVGTPEGLDRLDEKSGKFIHYTHDPGNEKSLSSNFIWRLYEDRKGVIWIGTGDPWFGKNPEDGGLNRFNEDGSFTRYLHDPKDPNSLINNKVAAMFEDNYGTFWVGTSGVGLHTMDRKTGRFERLHYNPASPDQFGLPTLSPNVNDKISFISGDSTGAVWIGTMYSGIIRYDAMNKRITRFFGSNGFPDSSSWQGYTSRDGEFWVSTENANLFRVDPFYKPIYNIQTGAQVNNFLEDNEGYLWVATFGNGVLKFDQRKNLIQQFKADPADPSSIQDNRISYLFQDKENMIWIGTFSGLRILNTLTNKFTKLQGIKPFSDSAHAGYVKIIKDNQGILWFTRWGIGLHSFNPADKTYKQFLNNSEDSTTIASNNLNGLVSDKSGNIWSCGEGGINRLNKATGHFKRYLQGTFITYLYEDSGGTLWAGTEKGLFRYSEKEDRFTSFFDPLSDLYSLTVGGIIEDHTKQLWLTSPSAIIRLNTSTGETHLYGIKYGIQPRSLSPWTFSHIDKTGKLYIGYDNGFYVFSPKDLDTSTKLNILITDLYINNLPVMAGRESPLKKPVEESDRLEVAFNQNNIAFTFSAIDYRTPELIRYSTMLENYDNTWREVRGEKSSYYFNIPPGNYVYRVKAYDPDGLIGEKAFAIHINPPWWKTWWAYTLYGLIVVSLLYVADRIQKQRIIEKERQKAQLVELAQAKEIEKAYNELRSTQALLIQSEKMASLGELTAGIAHEIQNPLNFVNNFSDLNQELINDLKEENEKGNASEVRNIADIIKDNEDKINFHGRRADAIVKSMLQHSRTSTGQKEPVDINALADEYLRLAYHGLRAKEKSFNAALQTDFDPAVGKVSVISQDIGRLLLNLYNNAFYAVMEKQKLLGNSFEPKVMVSTKKEGLAGSQHVLISIKDNGPGIPQKVLDKIFQPFFTTKPTGQGTGLGLSLSYDIIKAHHGEIKVDTREGEYSNFIISLPVV